MGAMCWAYSGDYGFSNFQAKGLQGLQGSSLREDEHGSLDDSQNLRPEALNPEAHSKRWV